MGNTFGLGLVLSFTDNASVAIGRVTNTISTLEATARGASSVLDSLGASMDALGSIGSTMSSLITAPVTGFLKQITEWGVQRASSVQQLQIAFETLMGSAKGASDYLDKVMGYAKTTPYAFDDLAQIAQQLISFGMDANVVLDQTGDKFGGLMQALGDWSGASATGVQGMSEIAYALAQASAVGKVDGNILDRLSMRGMQAAKIIGNLHGLTEDAAKDFIKTQMTADEFIQDLIKGIEEGTDGVNGKTAAMMGMVEKIKGTWVGAQDSFKSALKNAGLSLMGTYKDEEGITHYKFLESMTESLNNISSAIKNIASVLQPLMDIIEKVMLKTSEAVKNIAQYYADLDEETKRHIGNVVAVITLLGPALIVFSRFGTMLIRTVGFIKTFTTSMGTMSLILTTILFGIGTNFDGTRVKAEQFFEDIMNGITLAVKTVNEGADAVKKVFSNLTENKFSDRFTKNLMKVIGVIKAVASAWQDGFVDDDLWDLMNALGITPIVEAILNLKYNIENFFAGFSIGFQNVIAQAKEFLGTLIDIFEGTAIAPVLHLLQDLLHTWIEAGKGDYFKDLGERFANMLPMILAVMTGLKAFGGVGGIFRALTSSVGSFVGSLSRVGGGILAPILGSFSNIGGSFIDSIMPNFRSGALESARETLMSEFRDMFGDVDIGDRESALSSFIERTKNLGIPEDVVKAKGEECYDTFVQGLLEAESQAGGLSKTDFLNNLIAHPIEGMKSLFSSFGESILGFVKNLGTFLMSPLGIFTAIVALIGIMYATNEDFRESINMLIGSVVKILGVIISSLSPIFDVIKQVASVVFQIIRWIAEGLAPVITLIAGIINALAPVLKVILDIVMVPIKMIASFIKIIADGLQLFIDLILKIRDAIVSKIQPVIDTLSPVITRIGNFFDKVHNFLNGNGWTTTKQYNVGHEDKTINRDTKMGFTEFLNLGSQNENAFMSEEEQAEAKNTSSSNFNLKDFFGNKEEATEAKEEEAKNTVLNFDKGSIVIQIAEATKEEAEDLAERVIAIVRDRMETNSMSSYNQGLITQGRTFSAMLV